MNVYVTELEKWVESGLSTFEIRRLVAEIYFSRSMTSPNVHSIEPHQTLGPKLNDIREQIKHYKTRTKVSYKTTLRSV